MRTLSAIDQKVHFLKTQVVSLEAQLVSLKSELAQAERQATEEATSAIEGQDGKHESYGNSPNRRQKWPLLSEEYRRYGRQMVMPEIGLHGQLRLRASSVLIIGIGGLGCPAAAYLAGAGIGKIGLVDADTVEASNLHRQVIHNTRKVGMGKVDSAIEYLRELNPNCEYVPYRNRFSPETSLAMTAGYDLILDCTDHPTSRYLISDAAVLSGKQLVSASALRTEGQLMVLNNPPAPTGDSTGGPCYRCIFPKPPPADSVISCGEGGILGPVVGVMGILQALEAIKLIAGGSVSSDPFPMFVNTNKPDDPTLLLFSAFSSPQFRSVRLRKRRPDCMACSTNSTITQESLTSGSLDYVLFCGITNPVNMLSANERISASEYKKVADDKEAPHLLIDVREKVQHDICHIEGVVNVPFSQFQNGTALPKEGPPPWLPQNLPQNAPIYTVCRFGNDSQVAVRKMKEAGLDKGGRRYIGDIRGGLNAWRAEVDHDWPEY